MRQKGRYCGVPQCRTYQTAGISMHRIPKHVLENKNLEQQWAQALSMNRKWPKLFRICSKHFQKKYFLKKLNPGDKKAVIHLSKSAFPTENLPKSFLNAEPQISCLPASRNTLIHLQVESVDYLETTKQTEEYNELISENSLMDGEAVKKEDKEVQINSDSVFSQTKLTFITSLWNTERKLKIMTGIPSFAILDEMVENCDKFYNGRDNRMSIRDKILLTMRKLKSNITFAELATDFEITSHTAKKYFIEIIQLLVQILSEIKYSSPRGQKLSRLPGWVVILLKSKSFRKKLKTA